MFIVEVFKKCSEIALWEKRTRKTAPELLPESPKPTGEPHHSSHSYSSDVQHITPEGDEVEQIHKEVFHAQNLQQILLLVPPWVKKLPVTVSYNI